MRAVRNILALVMITALGAAGSLAADYKLGFVDAERVFKESRVGKEAMTRLQSLEDEKKSELQLLEGRITDLERELTVQGSVLSESARRDREDEIRREKIDFKRTAEDAERDLRRLEKSYLERIDNEVMVIIGRIGKEQGYTLIVGNVASGVLYVSPAIDLTDQVIAAYDKSDLGS